MKTSIDPTPKQMAYLGDLYIRQGYRVPKPISRKHASELISLAIAGKFPNAKELPDSWYTGGYVLRLDHDGPKILSGGKFHPISVKEAKRITRRRKVV